MIDAKSAHKKYATTVNLDQDHQRVYNYGKTQGGFQSVKDFSKYCQDLYNDIELKHKFLHSTCHGHKNRLK